MSPHTIRVQIVEFFLQAQGTYCNIFQQDIKGGVGQSQKRSKGTELKIFRLDNNYNYPGETMTMYSMSNKQDTKWAAVRGEAAFV